MKCLLCLCNVRNVIQDFIQRDLVNYFVYVEARSFGQSFHLLV